MQVIKSILLVLTLASTAGAVSPTTYHKIFADGFNGPLVPHAVLYSTITQNILATNAVQYVVLDSSGDAHGITLDVNRTTMTVTEPGCYEFVFSGICDSVVVTKKYIEVWLRHNGTPIPDSNTRVQIPDASTEMTVVVSFIVDMQAGDTFNLMTYGSDTGLRWLATDAGTNPARPATPSIILTMKKVSGIWNGSGRE